jgi:hypothetical protein
MPQSRTETCKLAIYAFMSNTYNDDIEYNIITLRTQCTAKMHFYEIRIPRTVIMYEVDEHNRNGENQPHEKVEKEQIFTDDILNIDGLFNNYFRQYAMVIDNNIVSSLRTVLVSVDNEELVAHVQVLYYNNYRPYPYRDDTHMEPVIIQTTEPVVSDDNAVVSNIEENKKQINRITNSIIEDQNDCISRGYQGLIIYIKQLEDKCNKLQEIKEANQDTIKTLNSTISESKYLDKYNRLKMLHDDQNEEHRILINDNRHYKRQYNSIKRDYAKCTTQLTASYRLPEIIMSLYGTTTTNQETCPVCYETIEVDNLKVPICGHFICNSCSGNCKICPICRLEY